MAIDPTALFSISYGLYVLTAHDGERDCGCIINSVMQLTETPLRIAVSVNRKNHTCEAIEKDGRLNLSILSEDAKMDVFTRFGFQSGRDVDKFKELGLTAIPAQKVKAPLIKECWGHIECTVVGEYLAGAHTMFVGEIVAASCNEGCFENSIVLGKDHARLIEFLGGNKYGILERYEEAPMVKE